MRGDGIAAVQIGIKCAASRINHSQVGRGAAYDTDFLNPLAKDIVDVAGLGNRRPAAVRLHGRRHLVGVIVTESPGETVADPSFRGFVPFRVVAVPPGAIRGKLVVRPNADAGANGIAVEVVRMRLRSRQGQFPVGIVAEAGADAVLYFARQPAIIIVDVAEAGQQGSAARAVGDPRDFVAEWVPSRKRTP